MFVSGAALAAVGASVSSSMTAGATTDKVKGGKERSVGRESIWHSDRTWV